MTPTPTAPVRPRRRAASALRGVQAGRPAVDGPASRTPPDPEIHALVVDPFESVADTHRRLATLEATFRERGDRRGAFLSIYARVTAAVGAAVDRGEFDDPAWVADYLVAFADLYREALLAYETGDLRRLPDPWQIAFETAERGDALVVQDAVLGINAHVNYDLALALCRVGIGPDRRTRYADHCAVNAVLRSLVDEVQDRLAAEYAPGIEDLDESFGRLDEALSLVTLTEGRDSAWRSAVALSSRFTVRRRFAAWVLRTSSTGFAHLLLAPTASRRVARALAEVERAD